MEWNQRFLKLANHLKNGVLGHEYFNFGLFNCIYDEDGTSWGCVGKCGTAGCALGECPIVFPDEWEFSKNSPFPILKNYDSDLIPIAHDSYISAELFFNITREECMHLFHPYKQNPKKYGGKLLTSDATKEEVANNILEFVKRRS